MLWWVGLFGVIFCEVVEEFGVLVGVEEFQDKLAGGLLVGSGCDEGLERFEPLGRREVKCRRHRVTRDL